MRRVRRDRLTATTFAITCPKVRASSCDSPTTLKGLGHSLGLLVEQVEERGGLLADQVDAAGVVNVVDVVPADALGPVLLLHEHTNAVTHRCHRSVKYTHKCKTAKLSISVDINRALAAPQRAPRTTGLQTTRKTLSRALLRQRARDRSNKASKNIDANKFLCRLPRSSP